VNLRKHAQGQMCRVRIPTICNGNVETTVLAHIKNGWYGSLKPPDIIGVHACSACHDEMDRRTMKLPIEHVDLCVFRALCEQLAYYVEEAIVKW
jgi:hypothetical protein